MSKEYSFVEVAELLGIQKVRLKDWINRKLIIPLTPPQQGKKAGYTKSDIYAISLFHKLINKGFKRELASKILNEIHRKRGPIATSAYVVYTTYKKEDGTSEMTHRFISGELEAHIILGYGGNPLHMASGVTMAPDLKENIPPGWFHVGEDDIFKNWEDVNIINLTLLRKEVDLAIEKIG